MHVPPFGRRIINPSTPSSHSARVLPIRSQFVSPNRLTCKTSHLAEELLEEVREIAGKDDVSKDLSCMTTTRLRSSPDTWGQDKILELLTRNWYWYWPLMDSFVQMKDTNRINMFVDESTQERKGLRCYLFRARIAKLGSFFYWRLFCSLLLDTPALWISCIIPWSYGSLLDTLVLCFFCILYPEDACYPGIMDMFFCIIEAQYSFLRVPRGPMVHQYHQVLTRLTSSSFLYLVWLRGPQCLVIATQDAVFFAIEDNRF